MTITHYDLFAGIGGFSLALEEVFTDAAIKHIFCEWESFPTAVLRQHWPDGEFWGDIADLVTHTATSGNAGTTADTDSRQSDTGASTEPISTERLERRPDDTSSRDGSAHTYPQHKGLEGRQQAEGPGHHGLLDRAGADEERQGFTIVTGGFPCQPFSHAGRRKGTADDRYQWPNMYQVIRNVKPEWVIAENVRGLVTWNDGLVLETVCTDLEAEGYEVQPFIIPAVAVGAPHRRDRVWIMGRKNVNDTETQRRSNGDTQHQRQTETSEHVHSHSGDEPSADTLNGRQGRTDSHRSRDGLEYPDWSRNWQEVAFATCDDSVDDGLSRLVDGVPYSRPKWRQHSLKAYGNGIVPEVAMNIMQAIKESI